MNTGCAIGHQTLFPTELLLHVAVDLRWTDGQWSYITASVLIRVEQPAAYVPSQPAEKWFLAGVLKKKILPHLACCLLSVQL